MKIVISLAIVYAGFAASFVLNGFLSRNLDLDGYGDIQVALGIASIGGALLIFGGQAAARRFIPQYLSGERWNEAKGFVAHYLKMAFWLGIGATVLALLAAGLFEYLNLERLTHEALFAICIAPLIAISMFLGAIIQSMRRTVAAIVPHEIMRPALFLAGCYVWLLFFPTFNEYEAIGILFVAMCLVVATQVYLVTGGLPFPWFGTMPAYDREAWHKVSIPLLYSALANSILVRVDVLALEILHTDENAVGVFTLLIFIASLVWMSLNATNNVVSPRIAELEGDLPGLQKLYNGAVASAFAINVTLAGLIAIFADAILGWFHGDLLNYKNWLYVVLAAAAVNCTIEVASPFVRLGGLQKEAAKVASAVLICTLLVTPLAIYLYGMEGAIVALIAMRFLRGTGYVYYMWTRLGVRPLRFSV